MILLGVRTLEGFVDWDFEAIAELGRQNRQSERG